MPIKVAMEENNRGTSNFNLKLGGAGGSLKSADGVEGMMYRQKQ